MGQGDSPSFLPTGRKDVVALKPGPKYLMIGSCLTDEMHLLRAILDGLNAQGREWRETIIIQGNGSLKMLEGEVEDRRHLEYRNVSDLYNPNVVIGFMQHMSQNRTTEKWLKDAHDRGIPTFVVASFSRG